MAWRCNSKISSNPMSSQRRMCLKVALFLGVMGFVGLGSSLRAQNSPSPDVVTSTVDPVVQRNIENWVIQGRGVPDDWTHHHLVFSDPGTEQQAVENGTFERWLEVSKQPRFTLEQVKRSRGAKELEREDVSAAMGAARRIGVILPRPVRRPVATLEKDWNVPIGGLAASTTGTVSSNGAGSGSTVTVDGQILTASSPTAASATGTFTGAPGASQSVTITNGSNALSLTTSATAATAIGTVSAAPTSTIAPTITLTNSAGSSPNILTLTNNGTGATATGTFSSTGPASGQTFTIQNGSNTLTLSLSGSAATPGTGTISVSNVIGAANGDTLTIGSVVYTFEQSTSGSTFCSENACPSNDNTNALFNCQTTAPCVWWGTTAANTAQALYAAITNNPAACPTVDLQGGVSIWQYTCYSYITAPNPSVTATVTTTTTPTNTGLLSLINTSGSSAPFLTTSTQGAFTLTSTAGSTIAGFSSGSGACTSSTAGTLNVNSTPATMASYLAAAINSCTTSYPAVGATASANAGAVTITDTTPGSSSTTLSLGGTATNFAWSSVTAGSLGTNGCSSATTGTFATGSTTAVVASNIAAAINSCNSSYPAVGVIANYASGNSTFTVTSPAPGPFLAESGSNLSGLFSWGSVVTGTAGTNTCTSSTSGTFATSSSATTLASNLATAISFCPAAAGITATSSGAVVTVTARTVGSSGNSIAIADGLSNFTWSGPDLSGGTDGTTSGTTFAYWSGAAAASMTQLAANIATAINANTTLGTLVSATPVGSQVIVTALMPGTVGNTYATTASLTGFTWTGATLTGGLDGATVQPNMAPAKYSFGTTTASCSDFVVYPTGTAGATRAASIAAFSNLYTVGCTGTVPSPSWAYNTGGMVTTSPVLSLDGSQVVFVQVSGTTASLVLLKWAPDAGTLTMPVTLSSQTAASYRGCTAPCMLTLPFNGNRNDTFSAPFYDYLGDAAYVGDDSGYLHKFTGVLNGTPAEVTSTWPVNLGTNKLSSPVYDGTAYVIVGDFGGVLHSVTAATGAIHGTTVSVGDVIADAPLVDGNAGTVYAFVTTGNVTYQHNHNAVFKLPTNFTSITAPTAAVFEPLGSGAAGYYLYAGTFDNVYYSSAAHTGNLYVVGNTSTAGGATLYRIPITASSMGTPVSAVTGLNSGSRPFPSPVSEFCNNGASACTSDGTKTTAGTDYVFFSVNRGNVAGCTNTAGNGCILSYNVSNPTGVVISGTGLNVTTPGTNGCWATGGIVVDNSVPTGTLAGASQTYFIGLGGNAAGGPTLGTKTSSNCTSGTAATISATQASQSNP